MGGFDQYIQNTSARELGDEGIKWRIILEQHIENERNPRKPIHPPPASAEEPIASTSAEPSSVGNPAFYSDPASYAMFAAASSKPQLPPMEQAEPSPSSSASASEKPSTSTLSSEDGLLFAPEARKRATSSVPRIPVFSRALQRSFVRQNVHKSILAARGHGGGNKRMGEPSRASL
jgi:hypothetical protein